MAAVRMFPHANASSIHSLVLVFCTRKPMISLKIFRLKGTNEENNQQVGPVSAFVHCHIASILGCCFHI
uniref:F-box family protein n=1 Tax=Rhizophora mucronata TaxID=61149 RepID=A0A2P2QPH4_RHIMU